MENNLKHCLDLVYKLLKAFIRNNWTLNQINKMSNDDILGQFHQVITGEAEVTLIDYIINCDADPLIPKEGWSVAKNKPGGKIRFYAPRFILYLPEEQDGQIIKGEKLLKELEHSTNQMLNANVLDFFLSHQGLIPNKWKGKNIFFWNTIYLDSKNQPVVRYLYWVNDRWNWYYNHLTDNLDFNDLTLILD